MKATKSKRKGGMGVGLGCCGCSFTDISDSELPPPEGETCDQCGTTAQFSVPVATYDVTCADFRSSVVWDVPPNSKNCIAAFGSAGMGVVNGTNTVTLTLQVQGAEGTGLEHCASNYYEKELADGQGGGIISLVIWGFFLCSGGLGNISSAPTGCSVKIRYSATEPPGDPVFPEIGVNNASCKYYSTVLEGNVGNGLDWDLGCCEDGSSNPDGDECVCCHEESESLVYGDNCGVECGTVQVD